MKIGASLFAVACVVSVLASPAQAQRLKVGDKVKNFTLKDQNDKDVSLKHLLKTSKVAVVFYRSAGW